MSRARKAIIGRPWGFWFFIAVLSWIFTGAAAYASYITTPLMAQEDPLGVFGWLVIPVFISAGVTWAWWDDVKWWRMARKTLSLVLDYSDKKILFKERVNGTLGLLEIDASPTILPSGSGKPMWILGYQAKFTKVGEENTSNEFVFKKDLIEKAYVITGKGLRFKALLPVVAIRRDEYLTYIAVIDPSNIEGRKYYSFSKEVFVEVEDSGWLVKTVVKGVAGRKVWLKMTCRIDDVETSIDIVKGEEVPINKSIVLFSEKPVIIAIPKGLEQPKYIIKAIGIKWGIPIGYALTKCSLSTKVET